MRSPTRTSACAYALDESDHGEPLWHLRARLLKIRSRFASHAEKNHGVSDALGRSDAGARRGRARKLSLHAQEPPRKADPVHGKAISYTCLGCHGVPGYKNAYPNYSVPELRGQHPEYLVARLAGIPQRRALALHHAFAGRRALRSGHGRYRRLLRRQRRWLPRTRSPRSTVPPLPRRVRLLSWRRWRRDHARCIRRSPGSTPTTSCGRSMNTRKAHGKNPIMATFVRKPDARPDEMRSRNTSPRERRRLRRCRVRQTRFARASSRRAARHQGFARRSRN